MAREWRQRCIDRGVPEEAFKHIAEVKSVLAYGKGSASARTNAFKDWFVSPAYMNAPMEKQVAAQRGFGAALFGREGAMEYCRSADDPDLVDNDESFAVQEDNAMAAGGEALASSDQNALSHLNIHFQKIGQIIQGYQQGQTPPEQAYTAVSSFGPHIKQHLDILAGDPFKKQEYQQFYNQWQQLSRLADKLQADLESAQEATPPQQQVSDKLQIGMANVQATAQINQAKAAAAAALKLRIQAHREQLDNAKLAGQQHRENVSTAHKIRTGNVTTAATLLQDSALTQADIQAKKAKSSAVK